MFQLLGAHPGPDISAAAAASLAGIGQAETDRSLAELTRAHLLAEHRLGRYAFHDLLHVYAAEQAAVAHDGEDRRSVRPGPLTNTRTRPAPSVACSTGS
jgi:hypothetical protein